jgi:hypothetical protein
MAKYTDQMTDFDHENNIISNYPTRGLMIDAMTLLVTTNDHYQIDIREANGDTSSMLPIDVDFDTSVNEGFWTYVQGFNKLTGQRWFKPEVHCYWQTSPQRADPSLIVNIPDCANAPGVDLSVRALVESRWNP